MTQPSVKTTFDTSLEEVRNPYTTDQGFSSSSSTLPSLPSHILPNSQIGSIPFRDLSTTETYDAWASTYDSDGNILQAVDDIQLADGLLDEVLALCREGAADGDRDLVLLDLGCGTGRNTRKLLTAAMQMDAREVRGVTVRGVDASEAMLEVARAKLRDALGGLKRQQQRVDADADTATTTTTAPALKLELEQADLLTTGLPGGYTATAHLVLSTLVLEHFPLDTFFSVLDKALKPNGVALVSNMHPDMGASTQAGFVNGAGERVRGWSAVHGIDETVGAAQRNWFDVLSVREGSVERSMLDGGLVGRRGEKWVGRKVWYGVVLRKGRGCEGS
ncbi:hypothetical protein H2203_008828 [Taxawa tesnikishii (nom. ined.)]|nr:hypothetical protein H2203_008828 [Dothideales sp. JES 119]